MRIGFALPSMFAFNGPGNGVRVQADAQADALTALGHEVVRLDAWRPRDGTRFDVVQVFGGGFPFHNVEWVQRPWCDRLALAPIIDTNQPNGLYRLAAEADRFAKRFRTSTGELRRQARGVDVVIARSRHEQDRVVHGLGVPRERVRVVLNGVATPVPADVRLAHALLGSERPFVLNVGAYCDPRKNVVRLIEAVGPTGLPLVIAGTPYDDGTSRRIDALATRFPNVRRFGYVAAETLRALYAACRVLALPSLHEGTGLVALEAAAYGAAVVITDRGGARDYFMDHAFYVDPYNTAAVRTAVGAAYARPPDGRLAEHVRSALTWDRSARQLTEAYAAAGRR